MGLGGTALAFAPALGVAAGIPTLAIYVAALAILVGALVTLLVVGENVYSLSLNAFCFLIVVGSALLRSPFQTNQTTEATASLILCLAYVLAMPVANKPALIRGLMIGLLIVGLCCSLFTLLDAGYKFTRQNGYTEERLYYLIIAAAVSASIPTSIILFKSARTRIFRFFCLAVVGLSIIALSSGLGRSALVSGVVVTALCTLAVLRLGRLEGGGRWNGVITGTALLAIVAGPVQYYFLSNNEYLSYRLLRLLDPQRELSIGRGELWDAAIRLGSEQPLAGRGVQWFEQTFGAYPHNVMLESWVDLGLPAAACIAIIYVSIVRGVLRRQVLNLSLPTLAIWLAALVAAAEGLKSGSLYHSRALFIYACAASMLRVVPQKYSPAYAAAASDAAYDRFQSGRP